MLQDLKSICRHFIIYGLGNIATRIIAFVLIPVYTHYLNPAQYGTLEILELTSYIVATGLGMGVSSSVLRFYYESDDMRGKKEVVSTAFLGLWGFSIFAVSLLLLFSTPISSLVFRDSENVSLFRLVFLGLLFGLTNEVPLALIRAQQKSTLYSLLSVSRFGIGLTLNILFVVVLEWGLKGILFGSVLVSAMASVFLTSYTLRWSGIHFSALQMKRLLRYGLPLIPSGMGLFILNFADRYFLQRFTSLSQVGIYSLGYKFGMILNPLVVSPYETILRPKLFEMAQSQSVKEFSSTLFTYFMFVLVMLGLGVSVLTRDMLEIISGAEFHGAYVIVPIVTLSYVLNGAYIHVQSALLLKKRTKNIAYVVTASALANILLNLFLVRWWGIWGAAIATLGSFSIMFALNLVVASRVYYIEYQYGRIIKMLLTAVALYAISLTLRVDSLVLSILTGVVLTLSFPLILFTLKFYSPLEIRNLKELTVSSVRSIRGILPGDREKEER